MAEHTRRRLRARGRAQPRRAGAARVGGALLCRAAVALAANTATDTFTATLPTATETETYTLPTATETYTLPTATETYTLPTATEEFTLPTVTEDGIITLPTATETETYTLPTVTTTKTGPGSCASTLCGIPRSTGNETDLVLDREWNMFGPQVQCVGADCPYHECCGGVRGNHIGSGADKGAEQGHWEAPRWLFFAECFDAEFQALPSGLTVNVTVEGCENWCHNNDTCWAYSTAGGVCRYASETVLGCTVPQTRYECGFTDATQQAACPYAMKALLPWFLQFSDTNDAGNVSYNLSSSEYSCGKDVIQHIFDISPAGCIAKCDQAVEPGPICVAATWRALPWPNPKLSIPFFVPTQFDLARYECVLWESLQCTVPEWACHGEMKTICDDAANSIPANWTDPSLSTDINGSSSGISLLYNGEILNVSAGACPPQGPCFYLKRGLSRVCLVSMMDFILSWGPLMCIGVLAMLCLTSTLYLCYNLRKDAGPDGAKTARPCCVLFLTSMPGLLVMVVPLCLLPDIRKDMILRCPDHTEPEWGVNLGMDDLAKPAEQGKNFTTQKPGTTVVITFFESTDNISCSGGDQIGVMWTGEHMCFAPADWGGARLRHDMRGVAVMRDTSIVEHMPYLGQYDFTLKCVENVTDIQAWFESRNEHIHSGRRVYNHPASTEIDLHNPHALVSMYSTKDGTCDRPAWEVLTPLVTKTEDDDEHHCVHPYNHAEMTLKFMCSHCKWMMWAGAMNAPLMIMVINSVCSLMAAYAVYIVWDVMPVKCKEKCEGEDIEEEDEESLWRLIATWICPCCFEHARDARLAEMVEEQPFEDVEEGQTVYIVDKPRDADSQPQAAPAHRDQSAMSAAASVAASAASRITSRFRSKKPVVTKCTVMKVERNTFEPPESDDEDEEMEVEEPVEGGGWVKLRIESTPPLYWPLGEDGCCTKLFCGCFSKRGLIWVDENYWVTMKISRMKENEETDEAALLWGQIWKKATETWDEYVESTKETLGEGEGITQFTKAEMAPNIAFIVFKVIFLVFFFLVGCKEVNERTYYTVWDRYQILYFRQVNSGTPLLLVEAGRGAIGSWAQLEEIKDGITKGASEDQIALIKSRAVKNIISTAVAVTFFLPPIFTHILPMIFAFPWLLVLLYVFGLKIFMELPAAVFEWIARDWKGLVSAHPVQARLYVTLYAFILKFSASFLIGLPLQMFYNYGVLLYSAEVPYWDITTRELESRNMVCFFEQGMNSQSLGEWLQFISFFF